MRLTAIILTNENEPAMQARSANFTPETHIVFHVPGVGVHGLLRDRRLPTVKQDSGPLEKRCAAALLHCDLTAGDDVKELAVLTGGGEPVSVLRPDVHRLIQICLRKSIDASAPPPEDRTLPDIYPADSGPVDFVTMTTSQSTPGWWETKGGFVADFLNNHGVSAAAIRLRRRSVQIAANMIDRLRPRIVVNRAMIIATEGIRELAAAWPATKFITVCHSSVGDLGRSNHWLGEVSEALQATEVPNIYFAHLDERNPFADFASRPAKVFWLPNVVMQPPAGRGERHAVPRVSLICAPRDLKNLPTQLLAAAMAAKQHPLKLVVSLLGDRPAWFAPFVELLGLDAEFAPWGDWHAYTRFVAESIDIGLQASFTESFNFVGVEHLLAGKPVVGSPALRYLPCEWQADPDNAADIANILLGQINDWTRCSAEARKRGRDVMDSCNTNLIKTVQRLLD